MLVWHRDCHTQVGQTLFDAPTASGSAAASRDGCDGGSDSDAAIEVGALGALSHARICRGIADFIEERDMDGLEAMFNQLNEDKNWQFACSWCTCSLFALSRPPAQPPGGQDFDGVS